LLIAGQRQVRVEAAERGVTASEAEVEARYADLAHQAWLLFSQLLASEERTRVLDDELRHLDNIKRIVTGRAASGAASQYDVLRLQVEGTSLATRLANARSDVTSNAGEIGTLLQLPGWLPHAAGRLSPLGLQVDLDQLRAQMEQHNPSIAAARKQEDAADAAVVSAKRERWPVPVFSLGSTWTNGPFSNVSYFGLSVELPIFDRKQGQISRATAEKHLALLSLQSLAAQTYAELERTTNVLVQKKTALATFEKEALSQLTNLEQMASDAYRLGKGGLIELLDATRTRTEIKLNHLELMSDVVKAEIDTLSAAGLLIDEVSARK
jgi:cobalt-zinc-cadmium efflux system outer membrane protein